MALLVRRLLCSPSVVLSSPSAGYGVRSCSHPHPHSDVLMDLCCLESASGMCSTLEDEQNTPVRPGRLQVPCMLKRGCLSPFLSCRIHEMAAYVFPWGDGACCAHSGGSQGQAPQMSGTIIMPTLDTHIRLWSSLQSDHPVTRTLVLGQIMRTGWAQKLTAVHALPPPPPRKSPGMPRHMP
jgi:hypothetical protein